MESFDWRRAVIKFIATGGIAYAGLKYIAGIDDGQTALGPVPVSNDMGLALTFGAASTVSEAIKDRALPMLPTNLATSTAVLGALQPVITGVVGVAANAALNQEYGFGFDAVTAKIFGIGVVSEWGSGYVQNIVAGEGTHSVDHPAMQ